MLKILIFLKDHTKVGKRKEDVNQPISKLGLKKDEVLPKKLVVGAVCRDQDGHRPTEPAVWVSHIHQHPQGAAGTAKLLVPIILPAQEGRSWCSLFRHVLDYLVLLCGSFPIDVTEFLMDYILAVPSSRHNSGASRVWAESINAPNVHLLQGCCALYLLNTYVVRPPLGAWSKTPEQWVVDSASSHKCRRYSQRCARLLRPKQVPQQQPPVCFTRLQYWKVSSSSFVVPWKMRLWTSARAPTGCPGPAWPLNAWRWLGYTAAVTVEVAAPWSVPFLIASAQGHLLEPVTTSSRLLPSSLACGAPWDQDGCFSYPFFSSFILLFSICIYIYNGSLYGTHT